MIIAVDGPSGSGKSSTARGVATRLGLRFLDTGAMYRAVTWSAVEHGLDLDDTAAVAQRARDLRLEISTDPGHQFVIADGTDVTAAIREPRISEVVSKIATNLEVRKELIRRQRAVIDNAQPSGGIVVEGRDIATVVATDAELKVLLTADQEARMARRGAEVGSLTAEQLREATLAAAKDADVVVMAAAVADFRPAAAGSSKIKKTGAPPDAVELVANPDILVELVAARASGELAAPVIVGFAAETGDDQADALSHGRTKLTRKGCDLLVVNEVSATKVFGRPDNAAVILSRAGFEQEIPLGPKTVLAAALCDAVVALLAR